MASILSIDPGINHIGWAFVGPEGLERCGLDKKLPLLRPDAVVVIEKPQVYSPRHWKGDPNDLIDLAIVVGKISERYAKHEVILVLPSQWKGQVSKEVTAARIDKELTQREKSVLDKALAKRPRYLRHNIYDAVGIGRWYFEKRNST